jgi:hypothetical protein
MNIDEVFNFMLAHSCAVDESPDGTCLFEFDLCCQHIRVYARLVRNLFDDCGNYVSSSYEVISYETFVPGERLS